MTTKKFNITIKLPSCDTWNTTREDVQQLLQDCLDVVTEDKGRWKVSVENQNEGLVSLNKVCDYLENINVNNYMDSNIFQMYHLIMDLRKAMEE